MTMPPARLETLKLFCAGANAREIAARRGVVVETVRTHQRLIREQYQTDSIVSCIVIAILRNDVVLTPWEFPPNARPDFITDRQLGVLYAIAQGKTEVEAGKLYGVGRYTVVREMVVLKSIFGTKRTRVVITRAMRSGILSTAKLREFYSAYLD